MCGIVGYVGPQDATPILLEGLSRLEYRGYDSAGIAVCTRSGLKVRKAKGRVADLAADLPVRFKGSPGIGHTRWATHGEPTAENAHPQVDTAQRIAVVHNGIIENADELRAKLSADGVEFVSQTDTETVAHLVARAFADGAADLEQAVRRALRSVDRRLRAGDHGRRAPRPHRRRPQRQPGAAGHRREGDVRRLRRRRADRAHPAGHLPRRRRAGHDHRGRLPHLHDRRPFHGEEPLHDRLGRRRRRDRRPRALPASRRSPSSRARSRGRSRGASTSASTRPGSAGSTSPSARPARSSASRSSAAARPATRAISARSSSRTSPACPPRRRPRRSSATATRWSSRTRSTSR